MEVTTEQRAWARVAGATMIAHFAVELLGDYPTILARGGETFAQTSAFVVENATLWRSALLAVGVAWIVSVVLAFALYVVLAPVNRRLAQLALLLRLGGALVGAASLMLRMSKTGVQLATTSDVFSTDQLARLASVLQQGINTGIYISWMFMGLGYILFFLLFKRSGYLPRAISNFGVYASALLVVVPVISFIWPPYGGTLKPVLLLCLLSETAAALWLLTKGLRSQSATPR